MTLQNLIQMLKEYDVKNIVSVDDGWSVAEGLEQKMKAQRVDGFLLGEYCDQYVIEVDEQEIGRFEEVRNLPLKDLETYKHEIPDVYEAICECLNVEIDRSLKTLDSIMDYLKAEESIMIYKGEKFYNEYEKLDGNTLYILDKDMGKNRENEFMDYILRIADKRKIYNDFIIIYSNEVSDLLTHEKKVQYLKENEIQGREFAILYQFWPISKIADKDELVQSMVEMISKSLYGKALNKMIELKHTSIEKAFEDLLQIDINNLDDMIIESFIEGGRITESYELLIDSLIKKNSLFQMMKTEILAYEKELLKYEAKRGEEILRKEKIVNNNKYNDFRKRSDKKKVVGAPYKDTLLYGVADYSIIIKYCNPSMGDIFIYTEASGKKQYAGMLISQECSLIIRKNKYVEKAARNANELLLLIFEIVEINKDIDDKLIKELDTCIWPIKINDKIYLLKNTKTSMYIDSDILDLCSLNSDGQARINYNIDVLEYKNIHSKEYYNDLKSRLIEKINNVRAQIAENYNLQKDSIDVGNVILSLAFGVSFNGDFILQRICKIDEKRTLHIIHEYLNGIGKIPLSIAPNL